MSFAFVHSLCCVCYVFYQINRQFLQYHFKSSPLNLSSGNFKLGGHSNPHSFFHRIQFSRNLVEYFRENLIIMEAFIYVVLIVEPLLGLTLPTVMGRMQKG